MRAIMAAAAGLLAVAMLAAAPDSFGHDQTATTPLGNLLSLEETTTTMTIPDDNLLPWGHVRGTVSNPAENYPVIIQFFKDNVPVHVAQVDLKSDDTYEYKFRVRNMVDGQPVDIFEGQYAVKIFKVVEARAGAV